MLVLLVFVLLSVALVFLPSFFGVHKEGVYPVIHLRLPKKVNFLELEHSMVRTYFDVLAAIKYWVQSDFRVFFLWTQGFVLWVIGCYSWILQISLAYTIAAYVSLVFCFLALAIRSSKIDAEFGYI